MKLSVRLVNTTNVRRLVQGHETTPLRVKEDIEYISSGRRQMSFLLKLPAVPSDGSRLNRKVGLACIIYEEGVEKVTFEHGLRDECSVFQAELLCISKSDPLSGWNSQFSYLHLILCAMSNLQKNMLWRFRIPLKIHFSYAQGHSGNDRADPLAKEATCQDMNLSMSVPLSQWEHLAWERTA
ncbi:hypothetical protein TNCV_2514351 [Trichonephila clavipes]|nr:hypothetical protein TNCV_2514351 [Trichonephila clavipes]